MMYASLSMESNRHNFLSFWAIFYPFTPPLTNQKIKTLKNERKKKKQTNKTPGDIIIFRDQMNKF